MRALDTTSVVCAVIGVALAVEAAEQMSPNLMALAGAIAFVAAVCAVIASHRYRAKEKKD